MSDSKKCSKCGEIKKFVKFGIDNNSRDKITSQCKVCRRENSKRWKEKNTARAKENHKRWRANNKKHIKEYMNKWYADNTNYCKEYYLKNKERYGALAKEWRTKNRGYLNKMEKYRMKNDIGFLIRCRLRKRLYSAIRNNYKAGSAVKDLGCSIVELKKYLEGQFKGDMSWDNYGEWHIDHIRPLVSFDLTAREQFLEACHYTNLQPLWAKDNLSKGSKYKIY